MRLNHRQLEAFRATMQTGMVTRAADLLCITQPAVSRLLSDLEHAVGFQLFARVKGRLNPTLEAKLLYDEVERSFSGIEKIARFSEGIRNYQIGTLSIASLPAMALSFLPRVITRFRLSYPRIRVHLITRPSDELLELIASQQIDIGFAATQSSHPAVDVSPLLETSLCCVLPMNHRLANRDVIRVEDLNDEPFITLGPEVGVRYQISRVFENHGVRRQIVIEAQLTSCACAFVREGAGVALVEPIGALEYTDKGVVAKPFLPSIRYTYHLLKPRHRPASRLLEPFLTRLQQELDTYPLLNAGS